MNRLHDGPQAASRSRAGRCPYTEKQCAGHAAALLDVIGHTGVAAAGICLGRHRVVWTSPRQEGPVGAWISTAFRLGPLRAEVFPGFDRAIARAVSERPGPGSGTTEPLLTVLPGERSPLPAEARISVVDRGPRRDAHLALVSLRDFVDGDAGMPPFEVAILRALVVAMNLEAAVTNADLRITWASPAFEDRTGMGTVTNRMLHEVASVQERDVLIDLARQVAHRRQDRPALSRTLPTGRSASVADRTHDVAISGLLWWWLPEPRGGVDGDRMASIESAVTRFVDDVAWAGIETTRLSAKVVGSLPTGEILTPREREILELLSTGLRAPSIATRLYLSPSTVRNHLSTAFKKMGVTSQAEFFELVATADAAGPGSGARGRRRGRRASSN